MWSEITRHLNEVKAEKTAALTPLAQGADLLVAGFNEQGVAQNVAEYHNIPLGVLHYFPARILHSGAFGPQVTKETDDAQRRLLGLPDRAADPVRPALEIQAYDELCLPGTAADWLDADTRDVSSVPSRSDCPVRPTARSWSGSPPVPRPSTSDSAARR